MHAHASNRYSVQCGRSSPAAELVIEILMQRFQAIFCAILVIVGTVSAQTTAHLQPSAGVVSEIPLTDASRNRPNWHMPAP